jgi:Na+:H+ antiporter, NhaA family
MSGNNKRSSRRLVLVERRPVAKPLARAIRAFLATEAGGGVALLTAAVLALIWANLAPEAYEGFWTTELGIRLGPLQLTEDLRHWINDALMSIFFFVVGLEIKRELVRGELQDSRKVALSAIGALGGMVMPALIYLALNAGREGSGGWGIPMATDIAFAVGVLTLMGPRVPSTLKVFLLSLAIADDIGAILVIAVFYSAGIELIPLAIGLCLLAFIVVLKQMRVWLILVYLVLGVALWLAIFRSGVHATIAGVALGLITPVKALHPGQHRRLAQFRTPPNTGDQNEDRSELDVGDARQARATLHASTSVAERLEYALHPWSSFAIVPLFALANAGVPLNPSALSDALGSRVTVGVILGLVVGKIVGISAFAWLAERLGMARLPEELRWSHIVGVAAVAGIGFTVALFIGGLAFDSQVLEEQAKVGILVGSALASVVGVLVLRMCGRVDREIDLRRQSA